MTIKWIITRKINRTPETRKKYQEKVSNPPLVGLVPYPVEIRKHIHPGRGRMTRPGYYFVIVVVCGCKNGKTGARIKMAMGIKPTIVSIRAITNMASWYFT